MTETTIPQKKQIKLSELKNLPKEDLVAIINKINDVKSAQKFKTQHYYLEKAHDKQLLFHNNKKRIRLFSGGNRSGKSTAGINELIWFATGTHPFQKTKVPIKQIVILQDYETHCKTIFEPKLEEWAPQNSIQRIEKNQTGAIKKIWWKCGSVTDIFTHDQAIKVFEGGDYDLAWFDEPPPQKIFSAVWRGLTDRGGIAFITATPLFEPWLFTKYKEWESDPENSLWWFCFVDSFANARNLGQGDIELGRKRIQEFINELPEDEREARQKGQFIQLRGLVFKSFSRGTHLIKPFDWPAHWPIWESIDPHPSKPSAVSWIGIAENGCKILLQSALFPGDMIEVANAILMYREKLPIQDGRRARIVKTLIDNYASAPLMTKSATNHIKDRVSIREEIENVIGPVVGGPRVEVAPKNVHGKIDIFKSWLTVRERDERVRADFYVFDTEDNDDFIREIESYAWQKYKNKDQGDLKDQPIKKNDDILDSVMQVALCMGDDNRMEEAIPYKSVSRGGSYGAFSIRRKD